MVSDDKYPVSRTLMKLLADPFPLRNVSFRKSLELPYKTIGVQNKNLVAYRHCSEMNKSDKTHIMHILGSISEAGTILQTFSRFCWHQLQRTPCCSAISVFNDQGHLNPGTMKGSFILVVIKPINYVCHSSPTPRSPGAQRIKCV